MKYIVIGLGYFGASLATHLTNQGHEVLGIDNREERVDELKDSITHVMEMDSSTESALKSLPISDADAVIVAIGEDIGSSILTLSILKNSGVKRIIGRAINPIHQNILHQLGIKEIVHPEEDSALFVSSMLQLKNTMVLTELNNEYAIAQISVPSKYTGHTLQSINVENRFDLKPVAVLLAPKINLMSTLFTKNFDVDVSCNKDTPLQEKDILVVVGRMNDIKRFAES